MHGMLNVQFCISCMVHLHILYILDVFIQPIPKNYSNILICDCHLVLTTTDYSESECL